MFKDYGVKGVTVCQEWLDNPKSFIAYALSLGFEVGDSVVRIKKGKGSHYEPGNIKCVKPQDIGKNRQDVRLLKVTFADGTELVEPAYRWSEIIGGGVGKGRFMHSAETSCDNLERALRLTGHIVQSVEAIGEPWERAKDFIMRLYNRRPLFPGSESLEILMALEAE